jgi:hypothetical protein
MSRFSEFFNPKPLTTQEYWQALYNQMQGILQGQMPAYYDILAKNMQSAMQSSANSLLAKSMANLSTMGLQNSGIQNAVMRDLMSNLSRGLSQYLGNTQQQIYGQAFSMLPTILSALAQGEMFQKQMQAQNIQSFLNALATVFSTLMGSIGQFTQSTSSSLPSIAAMATGV